MIRLEVFQAEAELNFAVGRQWIQGTASTGQMILGKSGHRGGRVQLIIQLSFVLGVENDELLDCASVEVGSWRSEAEAETVFTKVSDPEVSDWAGWEDVGGG